MSTHATTNRILVCYYVISFVFRLEAVFEFFDKKWGIPKRDVSTYAVYDINCVHSISRHVTGSGGRVCSICTFGIFFASSTPTYICDVYSIVVINPQDTKELFRGGNT